MENNAILTLEEAIKKYPICGRAKAYRLAAAGTFPGLIKIPGNRYKVSARVLERVINEGWQPAPES
jgi:hypothetical protein